MFWRFWDSLGVLLGDIWGGLGDMFVGHWGGLGDLWGHVGTIFAFSRQHRQRRGWQWKVSLTGFAIRGMV